LMMGNHLLQSGSRTATMHESLWVRGSMGNKGKEGSDSSVAPSSLTISSSQRADYAECE
jgi:hypothetical protein